MKGYRILFFTQEDRKIHGSTVGSWILQTARKLGAQGGTMAADAEGFGHAGKMHSAGFFEMADRPVTVSLVTDEATCEALMAAIAAEHVDVFYCRSPVEYGRLDGGKPDEG
jgi:PII-like signaling protein